MSERIFRDDLRNDFTKNIEPIKRFPAGNQINCGSAAGVSCLYAGHGYSCYSNAGYCMMNFSLRR